MEASDKNDRIPQAEEISAWIINETEDEDRAWINLYNGSLFPISKIILSLVNIQGRAAKGIDVPKEFRTFLSIVPPGTSYTTIQLHRGMNFLSGIEISFIDKDGQSWVRDGDGVLTKIDQTPYEYYKLPLPISWERPKNEMN